MLSWRELAARTLARQFPAEPEPGDVAGLLARVGPIQSQTARSVFIGVAARLPGVTRAQLTEAYESFGIVRGSTIRGTVHTCAARQHPLLEAATRIGQRGLWKRTLRLADSELDELWERIERFAADDWRTPDELVGRLRAWLAEGDPSARQQAEGGPFRSLSFGHGGLIRRPFNGDWSGQGAPGYRTAAAVLGDRSAVQGDRSTVLGDRSAVLGDRTAVQGDRSAVLGDRSAVLGDRSAVLGDRSAVLGDRSAVLADPEAAIDALLLDQVRAAGPVSRHDLAWWSGLGLTLVDAAVARLALTGEPGPDGRIYFDVEDPPAPARLAGVHLLPEFDALFCAFDPAGRARFVDPDHYQVLWKSANGMLSPPVLLDDRLRGHWRLIGSGGRRRLAVTLFPGTRDVEDDELAGPVVALELALGVAITDLEWT